MFSTMKCIVCAVVAQSTVALQMGGNNLNMGSHMTQEMKEIRMGHVFAWKVRYNLKLQRNQELLNEEIQAMITALKNNPYRVVDDRRFSNLEIEVERLETEVEGLLEDESIFDASEQVNTNLLININDMRALTANLADLKDYFTTWQTMEYLTRNRDNKNLYNSWLRQYVVTFADKIDVIEHNIKVRGRGPKLCNDIDELEEKITNLQKEAKIGWKIGNVSEDLFSQVQDLNQGFAKGICNAESHHLLSSDA